MNGEQIQVEPGREYRITDMGAVLEVTAVDEIGYKETKTYPIEVNGIVYIDVTGMFKYVRAGETVVFPEMTALDFTEKSEGEPLDYRIEVDGTEINGEYTVPDGKESLSVKYIVGDEIREFTVGVLPQEIKRAKEMVADRSVIITDANSQAEQIIKKAEERAKVLVSEEEVYKQAKAAADELVAQSRAMDASIKKAMVEKLDGILAESEKSILNALSQIKSMREAVKAASKKTNS